ncbi:glycoside hydrolase family 99-like domain-containing protein [Kribbella kalugense]|uniref:Glycosyl transferase family WbsX n=1 Tax=Kribbella kalugense TaxID=2512221 RepID=A0A4R8A1E2_9ACTN|nr:glycoside hydrolase family 99-like domain-containing protein [Kribbella kalugense]TDW21940.1 glycosyl transferase family WbsX [Kribbella kalugense]
MERPKVLAYYFPDWHQDPRNARWFGPGWDEWALLTSAKPRFEGHRQPRVPLHGPFDEATPAAAEQQIRLAKQYGVDGFLVDYYWYDDGSYLQAALDEGLLSAENSDDVELALMWANHELVDIFPHRDPADQNPRQLKSGAIDRQAFEKMARHIIDAYFSRPNYLTIEGRPWFSIYELGNLIRGLGGVDETADALGWFDEEVRRAGFPGLHLDAVIWGIGVLPAAITSSDPAELVQQLGFRSATSYVWVHHADMNDFEFPAAEIAPLREAAFAEYEGYAAELDVPFYPNVTVGWDPSPRTDQSRAFVRGRYPWTSTWDPTPLEFRDGLVAARSFLERHGQPHPIVTINAWNEWTEGSVLLPDNHHGNGFLEMILEVFGRRDDRVE